MTRASHHTDEASRRLQQRRHGFGDTRRVVVGVDGGGVLVDAAHFQLRLDPAGGAMVGRDPFGPRFHQDGFEPERSSPPHEVEGDGRRGKDDQPRRWNVRLEIHLDRSELVRVGVSRRRG